MEGEKRRIKILNILNNQKDAISGSTLAKKLNVSRQIIVQDIPLLRATNKQILSTNKGYILFHQEISSKCKRVYKVKHKNDEMLDELYTIVDAGGELINVVVEHPIYGQILVDLVIKNRVDAENFVSAVEKYKTKPLTALTDGVHFHTVEGANKNVLDLIEKKLMKKGYLMKSE
jgi:transcriptional regulator of NAD metabolism